MQKIFFVFAFLFGIQTLLFSQNLQNLASQNTKSQIKSKASPQYSIINKESPEKSRKTDYNTLPKEQQKMIPDLNPLFKMSIVDDNSLVLDGTWQVEVNPKEFLVNIKGSNISNLADKDVENLTIDVFFTNTPNIVAGDFNGIRIASANIGTMDAYQMYNDLKVKAGMINIPDSGNYYMLLTVSSTDENGNQIVRSSRSFKNPITF